LLHAIQPSFSTGRRKVTVHGSSQRRDFAMSTNFHELIGIFCAFQAAILCARRAIFSTPKLTDQAFITFERL
jgi:hypothetical protein